MPELPEVETIVNQFQTRIVSSTVTDIVFYRDTLRGKIPISTVKDVLLDQIITSCHRRSRYIICTTDRGSIISHLGMSGRYLFLPSFEPQFPHTHFILKLQHPNTDKSEDRYLHYVDPRRFGLLSATTEKNWSSHPLLKDIGLEPLSPSPTDLAKHFKTVGDKSTQPIKVFLMDAKKVAGIGNIYANEALFLSNIHPFTPVRDLGLKDLIKLAKAIQKILSEAVLAGGTTIRDYQNAKGQKGSFTNHLKVYGRHELECLVCHHIIERAVIGSRSTFFCSVCQKPNHLG